MFKTYDSGYRGQCPLEKHDQEAFVAFVRLQYKDTFGAVIIHVENEGNRTYGQANYSKKQGLTPGTSDIIIPGSPTFCLEMKRKDKTKTKFSDKQKNYLNAAAKVGAFACVAYGYDQAVIAFSNWLKIQGD